MSLDERALQERLSWCGTGFASSLAWKLAARCTLILRRPAVERLAFISQRSHARYVMLDLAIAARRLGWTVQWLDLEGLLIQTCREPDEQKRKTVAMLVGALQRFDADLVFSYGLEYLERSFTSYLPEMTCSLQDLFPRPSVHFFFDFGFPFDGALDRPEARFYVDQLRQDSRLVYCWDRLALEQLQSAGLTGARYFPMAANEEMFHPCAPAQGDEIPVLFVGGPTPGRISVLERVADQGLQIYGYDRAGWCQSARLAGCYRGEVVARDELRGLYQRAKIALNVTRPHGVSSLNMRVFEAMCCGSLMLTDARSDAGRLFELDRKIVEYSDADRLSGLVGHFLSHDVQRKAIAQAGAARVRAEHSYVARLGARYSELRLFLGIQTDDATGQVRARR